MSVVDELRDRLEAVREKASGELGEVASKVQAALEELVDDDGVADEVTERVAKVLKGAAEKLDVVADKVSGLFENKPEAPQGPAE